MTNEWVAGNRARQGEDETMIEYAVRIAEYWLSAEDELEWLRR